MCVCETVMNRPIPNSQRTQTMYICDHSLQLRECVCVELLRLYDLLTRNNTRTYRLCETVVCAWLHLSWAARPSAVWFAERLEHLRASLLFFKKKKHTVECGADSQEVMWRLK